MKNSGIQVAAFALALTACEAGTPETACMSYGLSGHNGRNFNGIRINGLRINGLRINGLRVNGLPLKNGRTPNGYSKNGITRNGTLASDAGEVRGFSRRALDRDGNKIELREDVDLIGATVFAVTDGGVHLPLLVRAGESDATGLPHYSLVTEDGENICDGATAGLFIPGVWDDSGARHDSLLIDGESVSMTYSCTSGVIAKCARWGFNPWEGYADLHQTCTRMARADYCGDGVAHTQNGTTIDVFDREGIQVQESGEEFVFEAGWGPDGAVCVNKPRYAGEPTCWADKPRCADWEDAQAEGALIGNRSAPLTAANTCD
jgi:hypothetical protein